MSSEPDPRAGLLAGAPSAIFVGRSLLTGRAVCLLFMEDGRVTRSIPSGGLESFDWTRHEADHSGDSGTWALDGAELTVAWRDGGIQRGPLVIHPSGIEFYGKRYARPVTVAIADLAGTWEAASGSAITGGDGVNVLSSLIVEADGRYAWADVVGGVVEGRATSTRRSTSGTLQIARQTMTFTADDGSVVARTFLPVGGEPLEAFSLDAELFTRTA